MAIVHVGIGSNIGDRIGHLTAAMISLGHLGEVVACSSVYETAPVGGPTQDHYLNAVACLDTELAPHDLLSRLQGLEKSAGRTRDVRRGPRTLDLDILTYGDEIIDEHGLTIPHPEIRNRRFVLAPLVDVTPGLSDGDGPYAASLLGVEDQMIRRLTGPYNVPEKRWLMGLEEATELRESGGRFIAGTPHDWSNSTGDMFGAYLSALTLRSVAEVARGHQPSSLTYRFVHSVPQGADIEVEPIMIRGTEKSADFVVSLMVEGQVMGRASITTIAKPRVITNAPQAPEVAPLSECTPVDELFASVGLLVGASAHNWRPLEKWDTPDLDAGKSDLFRAWSPNLTLGCEDPFLRAATILVPIDALIWPATMLRLGTLGTEEIVVTPTLDFSGRFPNLSEDPGWHLGEVSIDHMTNRSVAGTVRIWSDRGSYLSIGTSYNLLVAGEDLLTYLSET